MTCSICNTKSIFKFYIYKWRVHVCNVLNQNVMYHFMLNVVEELVYLWILDKQIKFISKCIVKNTPLQSLEEFMNRKKEDIKMKYPDL